MCGIAGIYGLKDRIDRENLVSSMNKQMAHRGPDNSSIFSDELVTLGHRRLSIIDTVDSSNQPMNSNCGNFTIVFNGEIYNYQELKKQLTGYSFKTNSDTEVLLAGYKKWGKSILQKLNGMFAFAIWDQTEKSLLIARDRLGIKPLYYVSKENSFAFASEISPLIKLPFVSKELNRDSLVDYMRYFTVHAPDTILKDVSVLMPGTYMLISENETQIEKYWDVRKDFSRKGYNLSIEETQREVNSLLSESVKRRLVSDVPFGAFLSGGIDSSLVVGLMSEHSSNVNTFNISFQEKEFSEAKYAKIVADKFATNHTEIELTPNHLLEIIPDALEAQDFPSLDGFNTYLVSKVTKEAGVTMALSGLGGDELFAGYDVFKRLSTIKDNFWISSFPSALRVLPTSFLKLVKPSISSDKLHESFKQDFLDLEYLYPITRQVFLDDSVGKILNTSLSENRILKRLKSDIAFGTEGYDIPYLSKISYAEINTYLQNILLRDTDVMSMASSLEVRVPFLDHKLVEFVFGVLDEQKYPHSPKKLLVDSFKDILPSEVVNRPKMGFVFPWEKWLKRELKTLVEDKLDSFSKRDFVNEKEIYDLFDKFLKGNKRINWSRIWGIVVLENWLSKHNI